jgi:A/G-specific adenine glycosylase
MTFEFDPVLFSRDLLAWYAENQRSLPWRQTTDPYAIWVSEIMLQQTRVAAVIPYYERFLARFPNIAALATVSEAELLAHWAGLGYYYRARNMQRAAQAIVLAGEFPRTYDHIRALPGIGDYTAAAVASIAFGLPHAVLDGNVFRVLARVLADDTNIAGNGARAYFTRIANLLLDQERPGMFNQAIMELGATVCSPREPRCLLCPVSGMCRARAAGRQNHFPVKIALQKNVHQKRFLFWIERKHEILAWRRAADSRLMPGFWELPESTQIPGAASERLLGAFRHGITFHTYSFHLMAAKAPPDIGQCEWLACDQLDMLPLSTVFRKAQRLVLKLRNRALHASVGED